MLCQFERLIYPKETVSGSNAFMIALYRPCEEIVDSGGNRLTQIKAVGYCLPVTAQLQYEMQGHWSKDPKHGVQFEVENYDEVISPTREGITAYLASGQIKGVGPKLAERIFDAFGLQSLEILDKEPEKLLSISGISEMKLQKICNSYMENRSARDVVSFLLPHGITPNRAVRLYREYGGKTMETLRQRPYCLCEVAGIGFKTADSIAMNMGLDRLSTMRVDEGLLYTLAEAESKGHLCMEKHAFIEASLKKMDTPELTEDMAANRAVRLVHRGKLMTYRGNVYRAGTACAEKQLAESIQRQLKSAKLHSYEDLEAAIDQEERKLHMTFAPEQRTAVKMALTEGVSIITGGPGTGKTLIQRAILDIYQQKNPDKEICCCAPTGRAARRMEQSTGFRASTVHKTLGLLAGEDGYYTEPVDLHADLILADEISMLDVYLAGHLFAAIKPDAQIVLIGDSDQLPSVGPGAVLSEMIASGCIPVVKLDRVFRQNAGSRIAVNAKLIRHGNLGLEYGNDFQLIESPDLSESADRIVELYVREAARCGVDNVALLTPYRKKTETGVNALNERLRDRINPPSPQKAEITCQNRTFRCGDKIMQIRNREDISNGDIGYIRSIVQSGDEIAVHIDFGDGRLKIYDPSDMGLVELGYASTIHKSQGSEYQTVIINLQCAHSIMLTRPLIYTAITRGKEKVILVGQRRALCIAINRTDTEKRGTCLAKRLQEAAVKEGSS